MRADNLRFGAWLRDYPRLANIAFHEITGDDLARWCDAHLKQVSVSSVLRETRQYRPIWTLDVMQCKWAGKSPWQEIRLPAKAYARRRISGWLEV